MISNSILGRRGVLISLTGVTTSLALPASARSPSSGHRELAEYLEAWKARDIEAIVRCMDAGVRLIGPNLAEVGRDAYRASTHRFLARVSSVAMDAAAPIHHGHLIWWCFDCGPQIGVVPTAERIVLERGLIAVSELIFDTAPFKAVSCK